MQIPGTITNAHSSSRQNGHAHAPSSSSLILLLQPPRSHRQRLQPLRRPTDPHEECNCAENDTDDIRDIIPITLHNTSSTAIDATLLLCFEGTREGILDERHALFEMGWLSSLMIGVEGLAGSDGEEVDELEDEVAGKCAAEV